MSKGLYRATVHEVPRVGHNLRSTPPSANIREEIILILYTHPESENMRILPNLFFKASITQYQNQ